MRFMFFVKAIPAVRKPDAGPYGAMASSADRRSRLPPRAHLRRRLHRHQPAAVEHAASLESPGRRACPSLHSVRGVGFPERPYAVRAYMSRIEVLLLRASRRHHSHADCLANWIDERARAYRHGLLKNTGRSRSERGNTVCQNKEPAPRGRCGHRLRWAFPVVPLPLSTVYGRVRDSRLLPFDVATQPQIDEWMVAPCDFPSP